MPAHARTHDIVAAPAILAQLSRLDDQYREFNVRASEAKMYGIEPGWLDAWKAMGLAARRRNGVEFFDPLDLRNLSLHLGLPSRYRLAMRRWAAAFAESEHSRSCELRYSLADSLAPQEAIDVLTPTGLVRMAVGSGTDFYRTVVRSEARHVLLPATVARLMSDTAAGMRFYWLPDPLRWKSRFVSEQQLAECGSFSKRLAQAACAQGIEARHVYGLLMSVPYAFGHHWCEFLVDGEWISADPLMTNLLVQHAGLPAADWPAHRSPGSALLRLACVAGYDKAGAPLLDGFETPGYRQMPVLTRGLHCYRPSYLVRTLEGKAAM